MTFSTTTLLTPSLADSRPSHTDSRAGRRLLLVAANRGRRAGRRLPPLGERPPGEPPVPPPQWRGGAARLPAGERAGPYHRRPAGGTEGCPPPPPALAPPSPGAAGRASQPRDGLRDAAGQEERSDRCCGQTSLSSSSPSPPRFAVVVPFPSRRCPAAPTAAKRNVPFPHGRGSGARGRRGREPRLAARPYGQPPLPPRVRTPLLARGAAPAPSDGSAGGRPAVAGLMGRRGERGGRWGKEGRVPVPPPGCVCKSGAQRAGRVREAEGQPCPARSRRRRSPMPPRGR